MDTDVLINWLLEETETGTNRELWKTPFAIVTAIECKKINGYVSLISVLETRSLLSRKKKFSSHLINDSIGKIKKVFKLTIPDHNELIGADKIQEKYLLDPFDSILLSTTVNLSDAVLISRDAKFLKIASRFVRAQTPEAFFK